MPRRSPLKIRVKAKVYVKNHVRKVERNINKILEERLNKISDQMVSELKRVLSKTGPSRPGSPPGITQRDHDERVPGGLMKSIQWSTNGKLSRRIGTPLPRGFWLEVGVRGGKIIRPVRAKALLVPIKGLVVQQMEKNKHRLTGGMGGFLGAVQKPNGQWYALRTFVIQGPIAPRPWLKPTFFRNLKRIGLTLGQKIY